MLSVVSSGRRPAPPEWSPSQRDTPSTSPSPSTRWSFPTSVSTDHTHAQKYLQYNRMLNAPPLRSPHQHDGVWIWTPTFWPETHQSELKPADWLHSVTWLSSWCSKNKEKNRMLRNLKPRPSRLWCVWDHPVPPNQYASCKHFCVVGCLKLQLAQTFLVLLLLLLLLLSLICRCEQCFSC